MRAEVLRDLFGVCCVIVGAIYAFGGHYSQGCWFLLCALLARP